MNYCLEYKYMKIGFSYKGVRVSLSRNAEHAAHIFSRLKQKDETILANFWKTWTPLVHSPLVTHLKYCNFKQLECKEILYTTKRTLIEPLSIFIGRGDHPLRGSVKLPITPYDVTVNTAQTIAPPPCGMRWSCSIRDPGAHWWGRYTDSAGLTKYLYNQPDTEQIKQKFDVARKLRRKLPAVRKLYVNLLQSSCQRKRQIGCVLYLIDVTCIRVGHSKDTSVCANSVGACTLRKEHVFLKPDSLHLKFLGKDSILFDRLISCSNAGVLKCLAESMKKKHNTDELFHLIDACDINETLQDVDSRFTAKVFRTFHASAMLQKLLQRCKENPANHYKSSIQKVAAHCNHTTTSTTKANYIDPRIVYAYCAKHSIAPERCITGHEWARCTPASFVF